ncbi:unnamed protein product, partial [Pleuronectes platessa]
MQVSIACTDHNLKRGNGDHSKQSATSPNVVNQARAKFRTVAIIARSFGSFTPRHISLKESTGKHTGMKYRIIQKLLVQTHTAALLGELGWDDIVEVVEANQDHVKDPREGSESTRFDTPLLCSSQSE